MCKHAYVYVWVHACMHAHTHGCMYVRMHVRRYACMAGWNYLFRYACMYMCMYVYLRLAVVSVLYSCDCLLNGCLYLVYMRERLQSHVHTSHAHTELRYGCAQQPACHKVYTNRKQF